MLGVDKKIRILKYLEQLEKWSEIRWLKFNIRKFRIAHLDRGNQLQQHEAETAK